MGTNEGGAMRYAQIYKIVLIFFVLPCGGAESYAESLYDRLENPIAVEKLIGTSESNIFAGRVGALRFFRIKKVIVISEFKSLGTYVRAQTQYFEISRINKLKNTIDFDCVDDIGYDWRGKVWRENDQSSVKVEMVRKDAPHRWVTLDEEGRAFLKANNLINIDLGFDGGIETVQ